MLPADSALLEAIRTDAHPIVGDARNDYEPLLGAIGESRFVLLGEASHGTHEFYRTRAEITKCLIVEKGFAAVAIEGDWPDTFRVHRFVQGRSDDADATDALEGFRRFPTWMWRNADVLGFLGWHERLERAIGVIYRPGPELVSHYFYARFPDQFDAVVHFDETRAVEPLERVGRETVEMPETYPSAV